MDLINCKAYLYEPSFKNSSVNLLTSVCCKPIRKFLEFEIYLSANIPYKALIHLQ